MLCVSAKAPLLPISICAPSRIRLTTCRLLRRHHMAQRNQQRLFAWHTLVAQLIFDISPAAGFLPFAWPWQTVLYHSERDLQLRSLMAQPHKTLRSQTASPAPCIEQRCTTLHRSCICLFCKYPVKYVWFRGCCLLVSIYSHTYIYIYISINIYIYIYVYVCTGSVF